MKPGKQREQVREERGEKKKICRVVLTYPTPFIGRDEAQAKIIAWREKIEKETQAYMQEIKDLDRSYEQDRKLKEFMATKAADRLEKLGADGGLHSDPAANRKKMGHGKKSTAWWMTGRGRRAAGGFL